MAKPKQDVYEVITREDGEEIYALLDHVIEQDREELRGMRIVLCWRFGWKPNVDGQLVLGKAALVTELDSKLSGFDGKILLNAEVWPTLSDEQKLAFLDHETRHFAPKLDKNGEHREDVNGRKLWRRVGHDLEEFTATYRKYGAWRPNLETFLAARNDAERPLLKLVASGG